MKAAALERKPILLFNEIRIFSSYILLRLFDKVNFNKKLYEVLNNM